MSRYDPPPDATAAGCLGCLFVLAIAAVLWLSILRLVIGTIVRLHS